MVHLRAIQRIRREAGGDDAESLARMFEDGRIADDGTLPGRIEAILEATEHRWIPWMHTFLDVPGLFELRGFADRGFRADLRDPWPVSRDQTGHLLTALALALYPARLEDRRLGIRVRDLAGAPRAMPNRAVAVRLAIGHEKAPDPGRYDLLILRKLRRQFAAASDGDVAVFDRAQTVLAAGTDVDLARARQALAGITVGCGQGNSAPDLLLTLVAYHLARLIDHATFVAPADVAAWLRRNLAAPLDPVPASETDRPCPPT
jgi:hypothetical protein